MNSTFISADSVEHCFQNVNTSCVKVSRSASVKIVMYFVLVLAVLVTICGNLVVVISISHFKQLHSPNNFLVLSLATTDLLLGLCVLPFSVIRTVETCWYLGSFFCRLHACMDMLFSTVSIYHLWFIAIDRYYAVCNPLLYTTKISIKVIYMFIMLAWILPSIYSFGLIFSKANDQGLEDLVAILSCEGGCLLLFNKLWSVLESLTFFVPCFIMIGIYAKIFRVAQKQAKTIHNIQNKIKTQEEKKRRVNQKREQKAAKALGILMGVFLICWLPYFIDLLIDGNINYVTPAFVFDGLAWLGYVNSAFNPLIYAFFYPWFRKALKLILTFKIFTSNSSKIKLYS
ncbi:trace amine-associated receptor 13c-like [Polypterus senegalus]|uniref:trace amine-associated receptor 13c-like n=1 Tax=Polypterus senegalus TaxID=55291 RepID=UPI001964ED0D|nr:trace amine-associated receptor 13c-like [Polypterus senegalus]